MAYRQRAGEEAMTCPQGIIWASALGMPLGIAAMMLAFLIGIAACIWAEGQRRTPSEEDDEDGSDQEHKP
jgi:hypothetical protein